MPSLSNVTTEESKNVARLGNVDVYSLKIYSQCSQHPFQHQFQYLDLDLDLDLYLDFQSSFHSLKTKT